MIASSGARLVEVGTTNRTLLADYERAIGPETALLLRVHHSNFRIVGFTESRRSGAGRAREAHELPVIDDLGSGPHRPRGRPTHGASPPGADLVCSPATSSWAGRRPASWSGARSRTLRRHPL